MQQQAVSAVNRSLTIRNWLIGYYIVEFEQKGEDRAGYGTRLIEELSKTINIKGLSSRNLHLFRLFYTAYPHIRQTLSAQLQSIGLDTTRMLQTLSAKSKSSRQTASPENKSVQTLSEQSGILVPADKIISKLSFSHITELLQIDDPLKRAFYEMECMKSTWSVRELRRQINSLYYERSGMSKKPAKLSAMIAEKAEMLQPADVIKSVYTFEFLGLKAKDVVEESEQENINTIYVN